MRGFGGFLTNFVTCLPVYHAFGRQAMPLGMQAGCQQSTNLAKRYHEQNGE